MNKNELIKLLENPEVFQINVLKPHSDHKYYQDVESAKEEVNSPFELSLSGEWDFKYANNLDEHDYDFYKLDYPREEFKKINVPGHIQLQGYDKPHYVNTQYPWDGVEQLKAGEVPKTFNPTASYVKYITLPKSFANQPIILRFDGVESAFNLWVNGKYVGYSEDSFTPTEFDITEFINYDQENKIALGVYKFSSGSWLEDQDFWRLSGIFRDVTIRTYPSTHIWDIDTKVTLLDNYTKASINVKLGILNPEGEVLVKLRDRDGKCVFEDKQEASASFNTEIILNNPHLWNSEDPYLYKLELAIIKKGEVEEVIVEDLGLREFKLINNILCINGKRIVFRGVNRHEFSHKNGRAITKEEMLWDVKTLKNYNFNSVRTSHYPNHSYFYKLCDRYGLYVIDEVNLETHGSWMELGACVPNENTVPGNRKEWLEACLQRAQNMYERDKNHPSIIMWSLGNESYGGSVLQAMHDYFHQVDPARVVTYEGIFWDRRYNDTSDVEARMYNNPAAIEEYLQNSPTKPYISIEYAHAMGNSCGNMDKYRALEYQYPQYQGGFIWDFIDQALLSKDKFGNDYLAFGGDFGDQPTDYNFCVNGLVYANREVSPKMQAIKGIFSPVLINVINNQVTIKNEYLFTNLNKFDFKITIETDGNIISEQVYNLDLKPGEMTSFEVNPTYNYNDELIMTFSLVTKVAENLIERGNIIASTQIINYNPAPSQTRSAKALSVVTGGVNLGINGKDFRILFGKNSGRIHSLKIKGTEYIINPNQSLMPHFWRASTDNDRGAQMDSKLSQFKIASLYQTLVDFKWEVTPEVVRVISVYDLNTSPKTFAQVVYEIDDAANIDVTLNYQGHEDISPMYSFGMTLALDEKYNKVNYSGFGPEENYPDRLYGARYGNYTYHVADNLSEYVIPQESGNRCFTRKFKVVNEQNQGLEFVANNTFDFKVLPYTDHELEYAYHHYDLPPIPKSVINIKGKTTGVGGDDSWGTWVYPEYQIPGSKNYQLKFRIRPV